jgi:L-amino acid N-acyltransferase YncA
LDKTVEISYYVHDDYQNMGIGNVMLKEMIEVCKSFGYKTIIAIVFNINAASIRLLEKNEFQKWGCLPDVVEIDGNTYSHLYYGKQI